MALYTVDDLAKARKLSRRRKFQGLDISVETQSGAYRHWYDPHVGKSGKTRMPHDYGYIRGTMGADGEHIDCYIGPDPDATHAYVVDQMKAPDFQVFDEQKVMLGFENAKAARAAYLTCYDKPGFFGRLKAVPMGEFRRQALRTTKEDPVVKAVREAVGRADKRKPRESAQYPPIIALPMMFAPRKNLVMVNVADMKKAQGPFIGPRGGKYADPKHTIPWTRYEPTKKSIVPMGNGMYFDLRKAKYVKRVATGNPKRPWRYIYSESAAASDVKAGEHLRLGKHVAEVLSVSKAGRVVIMLDGVRMNIAPGQWDNLVASHYGKKYYAWAEKRAKQSVNAVLKHVPRELLKDLKGTDEERMRQLQQRAPEVYAKLEQAFKRSGVNPFRAKRMLKAVLTRRGWKPEARAAVIGAVLEHRDHGHNQLIAGAENLAGGKRVGVEHVAAMVELRNPQGKQTLRQSITETAKKADAELATLQAAIAAARKGSPEDAAAALAAALSSPAIVKMGLLKRAMPDLQDKVVEPAREALLEVPALAPKPAPTRKGSSTDVYVAGDSGTPTAIAAEYRLVEAGEAIASHNPDTFSKRGEYPEGVQERAYHRDKSEQAKVMRNAQALNPAFVMNTNPDAVNGPPIMDESGVVLGGNSRTMSMQLAYSKHPEKAAQLRKYLAAHAHEVGLQSADVEAMKNPILVRVIPAQGGASQKLLVRQMNESFTQGMDPRTMQVAMGRKLTDDALDQMAVHMEPEETLNAFLSTSRAEPFINALMRAGVIDQRNANQYMVKGTKTLNEDGKTLVSRILVGRTVGDADLLSNTGTAMINNLARSVPLMAQAKRSGDGYDVSGDLRTALEAYNDLQHRVSMGHRAPLSPDMSEREFGNLFAQTEMFATGPTHPVADNPRALALLEVLIRKNGPAKMAGVFKAYATEASRNPEGQASMFGESETPTEVLRRVVSDSLKKAGAPRVLLKAGPFIGPRTPRIMLGIRPRPGTV